MARSRIARALSALMGPRLPLPRELQFCPACGDDCFAPLERECLADDHWHFVLRCGSCGDVRERTVSHVEAQAIERALGHGCGVIAKAADRLDRELMAGWVEAFAAGLRHDLIDVADFAAPR